MCILPFALNNKHTIIDSSDTRRRRVVIKMCLKRPLIQLQGILGTIECTNTNPRKALTTWRGGGGLWEKELEIVFQRLGLGSVSMLYHPPPCTTPTQTLANPEYLPQCGYQRVKDQLG